jgi:glycine oxidase
VKIGVVGAGVAGCVTALDAIGRGWDVTLFHAPDAPRCSSTAAGMLAPLAELEEADDTIFRLGMRSLELWPLLLGRLPHPVFFRRDGSLLIAHRSDLPLLRRVIMLIERKIGKRVELLSAAEVQAIEPDLQQHDGVYLPEEGQIDTQGFLESAESFLTGRCDVRKLRVTRTAAGEVEVDGGKTSRFDWVFDCRGIGGKREMPDLRGVRGEIIWVRAQGVSIQRPIRLVHPRYHVYVVPRPDHLYLVGASSIEAEDLSPLSVRTALELLSALYAVQPEFAEGRIVKTDVNLRPAFPDNRPHIEHGEGITRINGLFRHGYLLAPAVAEDAVSFVANRVTAEVELHAAH